MKNLFPFPRQILLALAVAFVALLALSTHQLVRAGTASAFAGLVIACTGMLAVLTVAALGQVVDVLKPLVLARVGSIGETSTNLSPPLTHRQHLELSIANAVVSAALLPSYDSNTIGRKARAALDALTAVPLNPSAPNPAAAPDPIEAKGKSATFVTPADIEAEIVREHYFTAAQGASHADAQAVPYDFGDIWSSSNLSQVTICVLVLRNGTKVLGVNYGAIDPARHDAKQGVDSARAAAVEQIWPLMGYELRSKLST